MTATTALFKLAGVVDGTAAMGPYKARVLRRKLCNVDRHGLLWCAQVLLVTASFFKRPSMTHHSSPSSVMQHTIVVRTPCRAIVATRATLQSCEQITRRGFYCAAHASELLGLEVRTSLLLGEPGETGLGLFTTRDREAWKIVDEYLGEIVSNDAFDTQPSPYAVRISQGRVIDSTRSSGCFARFANDGQGTGADNSCWLVSDRQFGLNWAEPRYTNGSGGRVWLMTNRAVRHGEELLVEYGSSYWSAASLVSRDGEEDGEL